MKIKKIAKNLNREFAAKIKLQNNLRTFRDFYNLTLIQINDEIVRAMLKKHQSYDWALKIVSSTPDAIPIVGDQIVALLRGGASVGAASLTRYYSIHTFVLPLVTAVFMLAHFLFIRKQGISGPL